MGLSVVKLKAARLRELSTELGVLSTSLLLVRSLLRLVGVELHKYVFTAQPVPRSASGPQRRRRRSVVVKEISSAEYDVKWFPRPAQVVSFRFEQGSVCFVAFRDAEPLGCLWINVGHYLEDEVACRYSLVPSDSVAWDYDVYVAPAFRGGRVFAYLWDEAFDWLRANGLTWTMSRIDAFNSASIRAHQRLGAQTIGHGLFLVAGKLQVGLFSLAPFVHVCWGREYPPTLVLHAP